MNSASLLTTISNIPALSIFKEAELMRSALKDTTQRYKSLTGFAIYAIACDISSMRYALRGVKGIYIISQPTAREVISLLSVACMASRENISHLRKQIYRHKKELLCPQKQCLQRKEDEEFYSSSSFSCR